MNYINAVYVSFTLQITRTHINVNGHYWNTCKLVFTGTHIWVLDYSYSCLCEHGLTRDLSCLLVNLYCWHFARSVAVLVAV